MSYNIVMYAWQNAPVGLYLMQLLFGKLLSELLKCGQKQSLLMQMRQGGTNQMTLEVKVW